MTQLVRCPKCAKSFSPVYARAIACSGCNSAILGDCGMIKCPFCGHEFSRGSAFY
ncbi:MAG: hypothetical protein ACTSRS_03400 [Candidatus Helarchaeota archaeon]